MEGVAIGPRAHERLQESLTKSHGARNVLEHAGPYLEGRKVQIINEMLGWFRSQTDGFDATVAIKYISCLNEASALLEQLERDIAEGNRAQAKLLSTTAPA